jgi:hypothetical protein
VDLAGAKHLAKAGTIDLWFMDESGFATIPNVQRSWSPLGKPHVADAGTYRKRVNVLGALNYRTGMLEYDLHSGSVKQAEVEKFIQRLAVQSDSERITLVVLDNARIHHAIEQEKLDEWMCRYGLCLCFLPTYSPELNLIELLWKQAKHHWHCFTTWSAEQLVNGVTTMLGRGGDPFKLSYP